MDWLTEGDAQPFVRLGFNSAEESITNIIKSRGVAIKNFETEKQA